MIDISELTSFAARVVKHIMSEVAVKLKELLSSLLRYLSSTVKESIRFNLVATDLLGIIRLTRDCFVSGSCPILVSFLFDKRSGKTKRKADLAKRKVLS